MAGGKKQRLLAAEFFEGSETVEVRCGWPLSRLFDSGLSMLHLILGLSFPASSRPLRGSHCMYEL